MRSRIAALALSLALAASGCFQVSKVYTNRNGGLPNDWSYDWEMSEDGRYLVFTSPATDIGTGTNPSHLRQIWRRNLATGETRLVSVAAGCVADPCLAGSSHSRHPAISTDGRYISFESEATNLLSVPDNAGFVDVFRADMDSGLIEVVHAGNGDSSAPSISADGDRISFTSFSTSLGVADANGRSDIYVRTMSGGALYERASVADDGTEPDRDSSNSKISGDGNVVAFTSQARNLGDSAGSSMYLYNGSLELLFSPGVQVVQDVDFDGDRVAIELVETAQFCSWSCIDYPTTRAAVIDDTGTNLIPGVVATGELVSNAPPTGARILADGEHVSYVAGVGPGNDPIEAYIAPLDGAPAVLVATSDDDALSLEGGIRTSGDGDLSLMVGPPSGNAHVVRLTYEPKISAITLDAPATPGASVEITISGANFLDNTVFAATSGVLVIAPVILDRSTAIATLQVDPSFIPGPVTVMAVNERIGVRSTDGCLACLTVNPN